ncbi:MAG: cupin domain-containing protein [Saprospiraceae bacterium]
MFTVEDYLNSGIIERYCLGLTNSQEGEKLLKLVEQYDEIAINLKEAQEQFNTFHKKFDKVAPLQSLEIIKQSIIENKRWEDAELLGEDKMLKEFISISKHSDIKLIKKLIKDIHLPTEYDNIFAKPLYKGKGKELFLFFVKKIVPMEEHPEVDESFLILEGTADCYIDDQVFNMEKGDFMQIPIHSKHKVIVTSSTPGIAIRSRVELETD